MSHRNTPAAGDTPPARPSTVSVSEVATDYRARGLAVCRIGRGEKRATAQGWPTR